MSMIGYLKETTFAQKKDDWRRYRELHTVMKSRENEKDAAAEKITKHIGVLYPEDESTIVDAVTACVRSYYIIDDSEIITNQGRSNYVPRMRSCEQLGACRNESCPFHADNKRYIDAALAYETARNEKSVFWKNLFAKHK